MENSDSLISLIQELSPPWSQNIACSAEWKAAVTNVLDLKHATLNEFDLSQRDIYDALYLSASCVPKNAHDFIPIFNTLNSGAMALLELEPKKWSRTDIKRIGKSMGAELKSFGAASRYGFLSNNPNKVAVLQKKAFASSQKKISILIPILSANRDNPRALQWIRFLKAMDLLPFVELVLVFDGIHDALPAWPECEGLEAERGFQMLRHYRSFGKRECMRSALYFGRGKYLLWDNHPVSCAELFSMIEYLPAKNSNVPTGVFAKTVASDPASGQAFGPPIGVSFFLLNRLAAILLYEQGGREEEKKPLKLLQEEAKSILKKNKALVKHVTLAMETDPHSSAQA